MSYELLLLAHAVHVPLILDGEALLGDRIQRFPLAVVKKHLLRRFLSIGGDGRLCQFTHLEDASMFELHGRRIQTLVDHSG